MVEFASASQGVAHKGIIAFVALLALGGGAGGYAIHEHNAAQNLAAENAQAAAALDATNHEINDLTAKVNTLTARSEAQAAAANAAAQAASDRRPAAGHRVIRREDPRYRKMQSQLDAQGKAIEQTRQDLAGTQGDLANTRTALSGSIAHTHDELILLEKKGERNFAEFDIVKSKEFRREGPVEVRLKKANIKHQFADLEMIVDDRNLAQKHVNLYQPVMFYTPDSPQPVEVVINNISKNHIHGYVSAPKYRQSELASMSSATDNAAASANQGGSQGPNAGPTTATDQPAPRQKLPVPEPQQ